MARPATRGTPSKRKPSTPKSSRTPTTPTPTGATTTTDGTLASFPPGVGPGSTPSLAQGKKPLSYHLISGGLVLGVLLSSSLALYSIRQLLRPTFGATAANQYSQIVLIALCAPGTLIPMLDPRIVLSIMGSAVALAPVVVYQAGRALARVEQVQELGPAVAAVLAQLLVVVPLVLCTVNLMKRWMPDQDYQLNGSIRAGFTTYAGLHSLGPIYAAILPHNDLINPCNVLSAAAVGITFLSILAPDEDPTSPADGAEGAAGGEKDVKVEKKEEGWKSSTLKMILLGLPVLLMSVPRLAVSNPFAPSGSGSDTQLRLSSCAPINYSGGPVRVLARADSVTGTLVVADNLLQGFRFLRCDNSLLGGQWLEGHEHEDGHGEETESIFAAFDLQQAVLLADRKKEVGDKALVIGLGVGTLPSALHAHGIPSTILEVDPLIPPFAREFFSFPELPTQIAEARFWLAQRTAQLANGTLSPSESNYAYVVHDVFTGGSVPGHMFAVEVFREIRQLMKPDGILAVNIVGELGGNAGRAVWLTLLAAFDQGTCRTFHDLPSAPAKGQMANLVVFCTPAPTLSFTALPKGFSKSRTTLQVLDSLPEREVTGEQMVGTISQHLEKEDWVVKEARNYMEKWTSGDVLQHWKAMRRAMPAEVWDEY
ncbi:hypothetical protein CALVIDRAFT_600355 [Calocera viscosa TUFC12733]|uniref:S-adenosyl-L-methionine-dependent methyltransferase n=1 Tax=Calocera viscosa (strain TUFC12733) TaxID=1330018 RepID=A0A167JSY5_CALVF|nr:hypothetical protein CALVIDRAFT_600355 [Calocera viscosa TUFC12733]